MLTRLRLCLSWLCPGRWCRRCSRTPPGGAHSLETCRSISLFFHTVCLSIRISWKCNFPRIQHVRQSVSVSVSQPSRHDECGPTFPPWWVWYYLPAMMSVVLPPRHDECGPTSPPWWVWFYLPAMMSVVLPPHHDECGPTSPTWWVWSYLPDMMSVVLPPRHDECGPTSPSWWVWSYLPAMMSAVMPPSDQPRAENELNPRPVISSLALNASFRVKKVWIRHLLYISLPESKRTMYFFSWF